MVASTAFIGVPVIDAVKGITAAVPEQTAETLARMVEAFNRRDAETVLALVDADVKFHTALVAARRKCRSG